MSFGGGGLRSLGSALGGGACSTTGGGARTAGGGARSTGGGRMTAGGGGDGTAAGREQGGARSVPAAANRRRGARMQQQAEEVQPAHSRIRTVDAPKRGQAATGGGVLMLAFQMPWYVTTGVANLAWMLVATCGVERGRQRRARSAAAPSTLAWPPLVPQPCSRRGPAGRAPCWSASRQTGRQAGRQAGSPAHVGGLLRVGGGDVQGGQPPGRVQDLGAPHAGAGDGAHKAAAAAQEDSRL